MADRKRTDADEERKAERMALVREAARSVRVEVYPAASRTAPRRVTFGSVAERDAWLTDPALDRPDQTPPMRSDVLTQEELRVLIRRRASFGMPIADTGRVRRSDEATRQRKALDMLEKLRSETERLRGTLAKAERFAAAVDLRAEDGSPVAALRVWLAACVLPPVVPHVDQRGWLAWFVRWFDEHNAPERSAREVALAALRAGWWPKEGAPRRGGMERSERAPKASAILKLAATAVRKVRRGY